MELYFLRHGIAADRGAVRVADDSQRPLTDEGIKKLRSEAKGIKCLRLGLEAVYSSPYVRARDTAEIVLDALKLRVPLHYTETLTPGARAEDFVAFLEGIAVERALFVGHEPSMSQLIAALIGGPQAAVEMKKGGLARVDCRIGDGRVYGCLVWLATPDMLEALA